MPSQQLFQIIAVSVPAGGSVVYQHNMNINGIPVKPDRVEFDQTAAGLTVNVALVTTTTITVANPTGDPLAGFMLLEVWHSLLRGFGVGSSNGFAGLTPQPFVVGGGSGGGGSSGNPQVFTYEVTGLEPDLSELDINLPAARAGTSYSVHPAQQTATNILGMAIDNSSKTINDFVLSLSGDATAGDIFSFYVVDSIP